MGGEISTKVRNVSEYYEGTICERSFRINKVLCKKYREMIFRLRNYREKKESDLRQLVKDPKLHPSGSSGYVHDILSSFPF